MASFQNGGVSIMVDPQRRANLRNVTPQMLCFSFPEKLEYETKAEHAEEPLEINSNLNAFVHGAAESMGEQD
jgi:hypothetical protein